MKTICFTGHRPDKLKRGYDLESFSYQKLRGALRNKIVEVINDIMGKSDETEFKFIVGGAIGIDQLAFSICEELKQEAKEYDACKIQLELAIPFEKQASKWFKKNVDVYELQKQQTDILTFVDTVEGYEFKGVEVGEYHPAKMMIRNRYMCDNSSIVIAVWNGSKGGTANAVNYAKKIGKEIIVINPDEI